MGQGAFGRVVKAEAIGLVDGEASTTVAVKMLKGISLCYQNLSMRLFLSYVKTFRRLSKQFWNFNGEEKENLE